MTKVAIMRPPSRAYSQRCSGSYLPINFEKAREQHLTLACIYKKHGYKVEFLPPSSKFAASVYMQDVAFSCGQQTLLTNCMSSWRTKEARHGDQLRKTLRRYTEVVGQMGLPAELDGGEVVKTDTEYLVGISKKTAYAGVKQIKKKLKLDLPIRTVKRGNDGFPHLGSGMSYLADNYLLAHPDFKSYRILKDKKYKVIWTPEYEYNGANVVRVSDDCLIVDENSPVTMEKLKKAGWNVEPVNLSEYHKSSGHISCLSINLVY